MLLGDESAGALGINVRRLQKELVLVASLMAGVTIAVSGTIGFDGTDGTAFTRLLVGEITKRYYRFLQLLGGILDGMGRCGSQNAHCSGRTSGWNFDSCHREVLSLSGC